MTDDNTLLSGEHVSDIVARHYDVGRPTACELIKEGFNHNYLVTTDNAQYVLRVYLNGKYYVKDTQDFKFELELLNYLYLKGLRVVQPVANRNEAWLSSERIEDTVRHFALFHFVDGVDAKSAVGSGLLRQNNIAEIGETIALVHQTADSFNCPYHRYHLNLETYLLDAPIKIFEQLLAERNMGDLSFFYNKANYYKERISVLNQRAPDYGLIHADLNIENILCGPKAEHTIIDFDHCAYGWRSYELAVAAFQNVNTRHAFLSGYETIRPLSDHEKELMPIFSELRGIWDHCDGTQFLPLWGEEITVQHLINIKEEFSSLV